MSKVPKDRFVKKKGDNGKDYYRIDYEILARFESASVEYKCQFQGSTYGSVKATYAQ